MEGNEIKWEIIDSSISALVFIETTMTINSSKSNPLFSCIITLYTLILLYFPQFALSPVLILTWVILLSLLRLGANQKTETCFDIFQNYQNTPADQSAIDEGTDILQQDNKWVSCESDFGSRSEMGFEFDKRFVEWDVRAPLRVIYEEDYNEEEEIMNQKDKDPTKIEMSNYYPETDSGSDSDDSGFPMIGEWDFSSPESMCLRWEEDEDREGLIEISLDGGNYYNNIEKEIGFHFEDHENLIEIDISQIKNNEFSIVD